MKKISVITKVVMRVFAFILMVISVVALTMSNFDVSIISFGMAMLLIMISLFMGENDD